jgi:hypothetical protein
VIVRAFPPKVIPFEAEKVICPLDPWIRTEFWVWTLCAAALSERVSPLLALAVVPVKPVRARVGFPWEWSDRAAVVRNAATFGTV